MQNGTVCFQLDIKGLASSRGASTPSYTTSSSLNGSSPRSLLATRKQPHHASTAHPREAKLRCVALPIGRDERNYSGLRTLMPHASASLGYAAVPDGTRSSGLPGNSREMQLQGTAPSVFSRILGVGSADPAELSQKTTPTPQSCSDNNASVLCEGRDQRVVPCRTAEVSTASPEELVSNEPQGKQLLESTSPHLRGINSSRSTDEVAYSAAVTSHPTRVASQYWSQETKQSFVHVNLEKGVGCALNPSDSTRRAFASVLSSRSAFSERISKILFSPVSELATCCLVGFALMRSHQNPRNAIVHCFGLP